MSKNITWNFDAVSSFINCIERIYMSKGVNDSRMMLGTILKNMTNDSDFHFTLRFKCLSLKRRLKP